MKILELEQGSDAWHLWRRTIITATDASVVLDKNPYTDIHELWQTKLGMIPAIESNAAMQRGVALEPEAREKACKELGIAFHPACVQCEEFPFMGASLDGLSECQNFIMEIKCPNAATHTFALEGGIHNYYYAQMQHQLAITQAELCYYVSYRPEHEAQPLKIIEVRPEPDYITDMIHAEEKFWRENMCQGKEPETISMKWKRDVG